jgi:RNA-directed DNA polymerase
VSPILANVYPHFGLDLWFENRVKAHCKGDAFILRYADDFICGFRYRDDAQRFFRELPKRLSKFNLEVALEKTINDTFQPLSSGNAKADCLFRL